MHCNSFPRPKTISLGSKVLEIPKTSKITEGVQSKRHPFSDSQKKKLLNIGFSKLQEISTDSTLPESASGIM